MSFRRDRGLRQEIGIGVCACVVRVIRRDRFGCSLRKYRAERRGERQAVRYALRLVVLTGYGQFSMIGPDMGT